MNDHRRDVFLYVVRILGARYHIPGVFIDLLETLGTHTRSVLRALRSFASLR